MGLLDEYDNRRESQARDKENQARLAQAYAVFTTTGQGTIQYAERIPFGLTFIEEPIVSYGGSLDIDDLANLIEDSTGVDVDTDSVAIPHVSGMVINWDQDERDFYIGCWVAVRVSWDATDGVPYDVMPEVKHHFTFAAVAIKDVPTS